MQWNAKWIWTKQPTPSQNYVCCFYDFFEISHNTQPAFLYITADTRYVVYCNGKEIGRGPIRSHSDNWFFDKYDISGLINHGENHITVRVWSYGISNYQALAHEAGLLYQVVQGGDTLACSNESTRVSLDEGVCSYTVKRNANMGFMEKYDARKFNQEWIYNSVICNNWQKAKVVEDKWGKINKNPLLPFHKEKVYPKRVVAVQEKRPSCQQVSVNLRDALFPKRTDINATIFSGFLLTVIDCPQNMQGIIAFPCRTWNGILGDFKIDGTLYEVCNENREIMVSLKAGKQLFLMQISGKFDDLFCHMEFCFPHKINFLPITPNAQTAFSTIGPTQVITEIVDGVAPIYGGLNEFDRFEHHTKEHDLIFAAYTQKELEAFNSKYINLEKNSVFYDEYIYSLVKTDKIVCSHPLTSQWNGVLWNNSAKTTIPIVDKDNVFCLTLDFEDIVLGAIEFTLEASAGTILDFYGFENYYEGKIDFTVGLNNSMRYICREGVQTYRCMARTGLRYVLVRVQQHKRAVNLYNICVLQSGYATSGSGTFRCSDAQLQQIWQASKRTHTLCMEDTFTDCPTYEQAFWIGDAQVSASINAAIYGEYSLMRHCLKLTPQMRKNTSLINALGPTDWNTNIPMWTMNWLLAIEQYVGYTSDYSIYSELYNDIKQTLDFYSQFITSEGLFVIQSWNMLDWAPMDIHNHGVVTGQQGILAYCYNHYSKIAENLGFENHGKTYKEYSIKLLKSIDEHLWDNEKSMFVDGFSQSHGNSKTVSIQTHLLLLLFDAVCNDEKRQIVERYVKNPPECFIQVGSPFMLFYLYELYAQNGRFEEVVQDIKQRWGAMLRYDCTTCWEVFPGFYEVGRTRSYCHSWSGAPAYFSNTYLLGVHKAEDGYKKIRLNVPTTSLSWCEGSIPTPFGAITVRWEITDENKTFFAQVPAQISINENEMEGWQVTIEKI